MGRLQNFVADLCEREGALVEEIDPDGLEIVAPPRLQRAMGIPDFCRVGFGAALPQGARRIGIEADWLDRFGEVIGERGRWCRFVLCPVNPALASGERILEHELVLGNAPFRLIEASPAWTRYLIFDFRFTALSDEKRDGTLRLGVNLATGAVLDGVLERLEPWLGRQVDEARVPEGVELPKSWSSQQLLDLLGRALRSRLELRLTPFVTSLRRRLARDQQRLYGYHNDLQHEAYRRLAALPKDAAGRNREERRIEAVSREYRAKLDDLARKYALRVAVDWIQTMDLALPVQRLTLLIRRRKGERVINLDWNPLARRLEQPPCEFSHAPDRPRLVCDDALHLVSYSGLAPCANCGRPYCRACHREHCPKCRHPAPCPVMAVELPPTPETRSGGRRVRRHATVPLPQG